MPSSEHHIRKAENFLRDVENHIPGDRAGSLERMAAIAQIHATLAVARAIRESNGIH